MFSLSHELDDTFEFGDTILKIDMSFDNILRLFEMFNDNTLENIEKIFLGLEILVLNYKEVKKIEFERQYELFKILLLEFLDIDLEKEDKEEKKIMDFEKDAGLIYASFFHAYKIDLFELQGKLHWYKFSNLLAHLPDNTAFKEVVSYRTMKVPNLKEASKEYREHVIKMKRIYKLENEEENPEQAFEYLANVFGGG